MAQLMPLPLTVSCFSKIQIGFTFLVPAHPGSPGHRAVKRVCVCVLQEALKKVKDKGRLEALYKKWWKDSSQCSRAPASTAATSGAVVLVPVLLAILMRFSGE